MGGDDMPDATNVRDLQHPLYLDVPMMISFLAAIEDGVTYEENVHRRTANRRAASGEASGGITLPSLLGVLPFDLRGRLSGELADEGSEELQLVKRHTEASLFNRLRSTLLNMEAVQLLDDEESDETVIVPGAIIEISGVVVRNPLEDILNFGQRFRPFLDNSTASRSATSQQPAHGSRRDRTGGQASRDGSRSGGQSTGGQRVSQPTLSDPIAIMDWMHEDLASSDMSDIVLRTNHNVFSHCILTLSKDFGTSRTVDSLLGAQVAVLGKLANATKEGEPASLLRRSILGYLPREQVAAMFGGLVENPLFGHMADTLEVNPPYLQIMPLAIYV
jgi:hypothetical protein